MLKRILLIFILFPFAVQSQLKFDFLKDNDGLSTKEIYELFCDSKGFIWVGHSNGISRFDGKRFTHYQHSLQNSLGISNIREDKDGRIWCRNFGGQIFYVERNKLNLLESYSWKEQQSFPTIFIDAKNRLIASHKNGLFVYDINSKKSSVISFDKEKKPLPNFSLGIYKGNCFAVFNGSFFSLEQNQLQKINVPSNFQEHQKQFQIVIGSFNDSLYLLNNKRDSILTCTVTNNSIAFIRKFAVEKGGIYGVYETSKNEAWICGKQITYSLTAPKSNETSIGSTSVCRDKTGRLWFSTLDKGIGYVITEENNSLTHLSPYFQSNNIKTIATDNKQILIGTNSGNLFWLNPTNFSVVKQLHEPNGLPIDALYTNNNTVYAGSTFLLRVNESKTRIDTIASVSSVKDLAMDKAGNVYVANAFSLMKVDRTGSKTIIRNKRCQVVEVDENGKVYAAFADGIFEFQNNTQTEIFYQQQSIYATSLALKNDTLFIGSISNGLIVYFNGNIIQHYNNQNKLLSNCVLKVKNIENNIWLLTPSSLDRLVNQNNIVHYTGNSNFVFRTIRDFSVCNNTIFLASANDLFTLNVVKSTQQQEPSLFIDAILVNKSDCIAYLKNEFSYHQNNITFSLSGLSFNENRSLLFKYRLIGADSIWHIADVNQTIIDFPALLPGKYVFESIAIDADGLLSKKSIYTFEILKPWWQQWWFRALVFCTIAFGFYGLYKYRLGLANKNNELLLEKLNLESDLRESMLTAIKSQMNPHFVFNALNTIQAYIYKSDENKASNYLGKFSDLIRLILDNSQKKTIVLSKEIEMLQLYIDLEVMRFENTMQAEISVDDKLNIESIYLPPMLVQPYVENAVKHGLLHKPKDRKLLLEFKLSENKSNLLIIVDDNGVGRKASEEINMQRRKSYTSFSTFANQNRFDLLNQTLKEKIVIKCIDKYSAENRPLGTTIVIEIPL